MEHFGFLRRIGPLALVALASSACGGKTSTGSVSQAGASAAPARLHLTSAQTLSLRA
jgi:hypothetical protein